VSRLALKRASSGEQFSAGMQQPRHPHAPEPGAATAGAAGTEHAAAPGQLLPYRNSLSDTGRSVIAVSCGGESKCMTIAYPGDKKRVHPEITVWA
jgi:hypothetical protein